MKKYMVLRKIGIFNAEEVRQFDNLDDARMFRNLLSSSEENERIQYNIVEVLEQGVYSPTSLLQLTIHNVCSYNMQLNLFDDITSVANKMYKNRTGRAQALYRDSIPIAQQHPQDSISRQLQLYKCYCLVPLFPRSTYHTSSSIKARITIPTSCYAEKRYMVETSNFKTARI